MDTKHAATREAIVVTERKRQVSARLLFAFAYGAILLLVIAPKLVLAAF